MNVICEKPLVLTCDDLFRLQELEKQYGKKSFVSFSFVFIPKSKKLKTRVENLFAGDKQRSKLQVSLDYVTSRGPWYKKSWKFDEIKSGGVASNIGIHFFDMLIRLFGYPTSFSIKENDPERLEGMLECPLAQVEFCLSIRQKDLPLEVRNSEQRSWRQMIIDGEPFDFTNGFTDLHTKSYEGNSGWQRIWTSGKHCRQFRFARASEERKGKTQRDA